MQADIIVKGDQQIARHTAKVMLGYAVRFVLKSEVKTDHGRETIARVSGTTQEDLNQWHTSDPGEGATYGEGSLITWNFVGEVK